VGEEMVYVLASVIVLLAIQLLFVLWNLRYLHSMERPINDVVPKQSGAPLISVLIPARNEQRNIGECIESVLAAVDKALIGGGVEIEVLVLDDRSEDATAHLVAQRAAAAPRLHLLAGDDLPPGWMGKSWACHQLTRHARGRWLLFLDADARLEPDALVRVCETAAHRDCGMITGFPRQIVRGALERLVVPLMAFTIACHLPIRFITRSQDAKFAAAHGAFILIARSTYDACGGHERYREHLVDDVMLARSVKKIGHPLQLLDVTDLVRMRMYQSDSEVWRGYKKNVFPGMGRNHLIFSIIFVLYAMLYLLPIITLLSILTVGAISFTPPDKALLMLSSGAYLLAVSIKAVVDYKNRISLWHALLIPISMLVLLLIMLDSWRTAISGKTYEWKGRRYS